MVEIAKPLPRPDERSEGFWEAASHHVLTVQRCGHCGHLAHPPVVVCPSCLSPDPSFSFAPVSGRGTLRTWTVMRDAFLPGFHKDVPWVVGEAELDDAPGVRLLARMTDPADSTFVIGAPVETVFDDVAPGCALPLLRLVTP